MTSYSCRKLLWVWTHLRPQVSEVSYVYSRSKPPHHHPLCFNWIFTNNTSSLCSNLVEIFPSEERLVLVFVEVDGEGVGLGAFLPQGAGAVPGQGVVPHPVVVRVPTRQDAAPAGAAQRRHRELHRGGSESSNKRTEGVRKNEKSSGSSEIWKDLNVSGSWSQFTGVTR